ncbi:MAG: terminase [Sphingobium sp.]|nr:terminase [Sphingobium sp.]
MVLPPADPPIPPVIPYDARRVARAYYWRGWGVTEIAGELGLSANTVTAWKNRDKWDEDPVIRRVEDSCEMRLNQLIFKEKKSGTDFKEIDLLGRQIERMARVRRYGEPGGHEGDINEKVSNRNKGERKKAPKNLITHEDTLKLKSAFLDGLYGYQETWWANIDRRTRMLLKSRQIGATWYFAREAFIRAMETGNNQIFISASRNQANIFRNYIIDFVFSVLGKQLAGDPMVIQREGEDGETLDPVTFYFLGTNFRTAQGYHGDVYIDECFWIYGFDQINKVASAISTQKRYHKTYFSTPSTIAHEAYPMWTGERFNRRRAKDKQVKIDIGHAALVGGSLGADGIWRHIVTLEDAMAQGFDLADIAELRLEYSIDEFNNLFLCHFVDDSQSSFPLSLIQPCMVESWEAWKGEFMPYGLRPYGTRPVWIGYDPAESEDGDNASCIIIAPPEKPGGKFRCLEKFQWKGKDYQAQAQEIKKLLSRYNVQEIAIDGTGMGSAVWQLVVKFFPLAKRINYSPVVKGEMVLKGQNVLRNRRVEIDTSWADLAQSLMSIHPKLTKGGGQITYAARRSSATGHGDLGWAFLHALSCEPLDASDGGHKKSTVEINR